MPFYISQISGTQIPYEPVTSAEIRQAGLPEFLIPNQSISQDSAVDNSQDIADASQDTFDTELATSLETEDAAIFDGSVENNIGQVATTVSTPVPSQVIASNPAISQAAASVIEKKSTHEVKSRISSDAVSYAPERFPVIQVQKGEASTGEVHSDELHHKEVTDAYKHARQPLESSPRVITEIREIMTSPVQTLQEDSSIDSVWQFLQEKRFRHIPIVSKEDKLIGVVSDRDFINLAKNDRISTIRQILKTNIITARPETDVRSAAKLMFEERIGALPIVDENEDLVGIITRSDILRVLFKRAPLELWL